MFLKGWLFLMWRGREFQRAGARKVFVRFVNFMVKRGEMKELKFWAAMSSISRRGVQMDYFTEVSWLVMFINIS